MKPILLIACIIVALVAFGCKREGKYQELGDSPADTDQTSDGRSTATSSTGASKASRRKNRHKKKGSSIVSAHTGDNSGITGAASGSAASETPGVNVENIALENLPNPNSGRNKKKGKGVGEAAGSASLFTDERNCGVQKFKQTAFHEGPTGMTATGQDDAAANSWPWHLRLVYTDPSTKQKTTCGATFIMAKGYKNTSDIAATAASCIAKMDPSTGNVKYLYQDHFWVILGSHRMRLSAQDETADQRKNVEKRLRIADWLKHDGYKGRYNEHNVAIVRLDEVVDVTDYISLICQPKEGAPGLTKDDKCVTVGWPGDGKTKTVPLKQLQMTFQKSDGKLIFAKATNRETGEVKKLFDNNNGASLMCFKHGIWIIYGVLVTNVMDKSAESFSFMRYRSYDGWIKTKSNDMSKVDQPIIQAHDSSQKTKNKPKTPNTAGSSKATGSQKPVKTDFINPTPKKLYRMAWNLWLADEGTRAKIHTDFKVQWGPNIPFTRDTLESVIAEPFFESVDKILMEIPIYKATWKLLEAHESNDRALHKERAQEFFKTVTESDVYRNLTGALADAGLTLANDRAKFNEKVETLWITERYIEERNSYAAFYKHHFIAKLFNNTKPGELSKIILGLHSWWSMYFYQVKGKLAYVGHVFALSEVIPTFRYKIGEYWKEYGSMFLGSSPAFDVSIIVLAYFTRQTGFAKFFLADCTPTMIQLSTWTVDGVKYLSKGYPGIFRLRDEKCPDYIPAAKPKRRD